MKIKPLIALLLTAVLASCNVVEQPANSDHVSGVSGKQSGQLSSDNALQGLRAFAQETPLTQQQIQLLKALGLRIAIPSYIPPGFQLKVVQAELAPSIQVGEAIYKLIYQNYDADSGKNFCFAVEATSGGIGGLPPGTTSYPINSPIFGQSTLEYGLYGDASRPTFLGNWLGTDEGPFYRFVGANVSPALSRCNNISSQEAVRVFESLQYLP